MGLPFIASVVGVMAAFLCAPETLAQQFPSKPILLIVPLAGGGGVADPLARLLAHKIQGPLGTPVVVENRPGASGIIGSVAVAKATADGHTLLLGHIGTHGVNPSLFPKLPYDPVRDFAPVSLVASVPNLLAVHPSVPANSVAELIALAKSRPGTLNFGSPGAGSSGHMAAELLKFMAGIDLVHVPYKGGGLSMRAAIAGEVHLIFDTISSSLAQVKAGKLRALAVTAPARIELAPDIPALSETVPGFETAPWFGILAPAGTPPSVVARLQSEIARAVALPDVREQLAQKQGINLIASTPDQFAAHIRSEIAKWARVVRETGARAD